MKVSRPIHLEIQTHRLKPVGILRSSFREGDKIKHTNHGRITGLSLSQLKLLQAAFRGEVIPKDSPEAFQILYSKKYGASYALLQLAKELGMDRALYSRKEPWVQDCLAMIAGRVVYAGSKLALSNQRKNTALWELCGVTGPVDVEKHCYLPMDRLLERQKAIQRTLAGKHLQSGHLVLYDITSTYFEGAYKDSDIVLFGYPTQEFEELYNRRWGIETYYGLIKSRLDLENFTGLSVEAVRQDLHATIFVSNFESILIQPAQEQVRQKSKSLKNPQQVNHAVSFHALKSQIIRLLLSSEPVPQVLPKLQQLFQDNPVSNRPRRKAPRKKKSAWRSYHFQRNIRKVVF